MTNKSFDQVLLPAVQVFQGLNPRGQVRLPGGQAFEAGHRQGQQLDRGWGEDLFEPGPRPSKKILYCIAV